MRRHSEPAKVQPMVDPDPNKLVLRALEIRGEANDSNRSIPVVIASENPVQRYDEEYGEFYNEILAMDGVQFRTSKRQLPIVDSHNVSTVRNVLGSIRNVRVEGSQLVGDAVFAADKESQDAYQKIRDGHLTDFSITARPGGVQRIRRGEKFEYNGQSVSGPAELITNWTPTDASLCATGADETSTVRSELLRSYDTTRKVKRMSEEMKAALIAKGMPETIATAEEALNWMLEATAERAEPEVTETEAEPIMSMDSVEEEPKEVQNMDEQKPEELVEKAVGRALEADRKKNKEIRALCERADLDRSFADSLCDSGIKLDAARVKIMERMMQNKEGGLGQNGESPRIEVTRSGDDSFRDAMRDGLLKRSLNSINSRVNPFEGGKAAEGSSDFERMSLFRMAETSLARSGVRTERMSPRDIALLAMGHPSTVRRYETEIRRDAYHTTGSFANLLLDAANKTLLAGYEEAPYTWSIWARQAPSVADFKAINRIRFSEMADPEMVPENHEYKEKKAADSKESYKVEKYGSLFSVTWETIVNDDLDAISRIPQMQGAACRRKQNKTVYDVLTANANMADTGALFNATAQTTAGGHANLAGSTGAPNVTTLNAGFLSMMTKTGMTIDGVAGPVLNIQPAYLIVPAALSATALQLVGSIADPTAGGSNAGNSQTKNIYGPNGDRPLRVIVEPVLDANSATAWYLAAMNTQVDTVELSFLQGEESPVLENEWDFDKDVYKYKVRQTWGVAPIDFRGLYKNAG